MMRAYITDVEVTAEAVVFTAYVDVGDWIKNKFKRGDGVELR